MVMNIEPLRDALHTRPFQPFRLQLGDGTSVDVSHPESLAFHPKSGRTIIVALPDGGFKAIDMMLVTALHVGNGAKPRQRKGKGGG